MAEKAAKNPMGTLPKGSKKSQRNLNYSKREEEIMKEIFVLLVHRKSIIKEMETLVTVDELDQLCSTLISMAIGTGETLYMIRLFVEDEFKKDYASQEGSIMRGNSLASKLTKAYLSKIGRGYLKNHLVGNIVTQIVINESKKSYEIDPIKSGEEDIERHKQLLLDKLKLMVDQITSPENVDKMPAEMRILAGYFAELAREYAPKQIWALVGGFIMLRYINPALMTPEAYELLPEGKLPSSKARRNLILITKVLQNLSNGVEFGKKEQFMMCMNSFIKEYTPKMEKYLERVVNFAAKSTVTTVADASSIGMTDLHFMHKLFTQNGDKIQSLFEDKDQAAQFSKLLEKLGSYQSKISFSFLDNQDQKSMLSLLEQNGEEAFFIGWVDKKKYNKIQKRLLVVGHYRILSVKPGGKVARDGHLLDLRIIRSPNSKELELKFKEFSIVCDSEEVDDIINCIRRSFEISFSGMPEALKPKLEVEPKSRINSIVIEDTEPCGRYVVAYKSLCNFYGLPPNFDLCWHFEHLPPSERTFDIRKFTKTFSENPLTAPDFGPLFWALRFNTYFTSLILKNYKLDKEAFLDLAETMKVNTTIQELVLSGVGGNKEGFIALFEAMAANKNCPVVHIDVSNNSIEDKGLIAFSTFLSVTPSNILTINIAKTDSGSQGLSSVLTVLKDRVKVKGSSVLANFCISDNKLSNTSELLSQLAGLAGSNLKVLKLSNTSASLEVVLEGIMKGCLKLESLDISRNKMRASDCMALSRFLNSSTSITEVNLSTTKFPIECLKNLLTVSNTLDLRLNLSENNLGVEGANIIASVPFSMNAINTLDLTDNDLGDEGIASIAEALCSNTTLKKLILDKNFKGEKKYRQLAVENLSKLITSNHSLESLSLAGGSKAGSQLKQDIVPFLYSVGQAASLTALDISGNQIGNAGVVALSKSLKINHTLTSLNWDDNLTGVLGFVNIRNALETNQTVRNMPVPVFDVQKALKSDGDANTTQLLVSQIQEHILRNQAF